MNSGMICFVVFLLLSAAAFFFLRLDYALLDWITARAERKAKIKSFKKQSRISKLVDKLLAKCVSLITNSQMPKTAYYILMEMNRRFYDDIICGPFFMVGDAGADFRSLTTEEINRYSELFAEPDQFSDYEPNAEPRAWIISF